MTTTTINGTTIQASRLDPYSIAGGDVLIVEGTLRAVVQVNHGRYGSGVNEVLFQDGSNIVVDQYSVVTGQQCAR